MYNIKTLLLFSKADIISTVEFNHDGELLATGDKGGRIVIFQRENAVSVKFLFYASLCLVWG